MGNTYANVTLHGPSQADIAAGVGSLGMAAVVSPTRERATVVFSSLETTMDLARGLSEEMKCPAWAVLVSDDDLLLYWLFNKGELLDEYNSCPGYSTGESLPPSGGDAGVLCRALGRPATADAVLAILKEPKNIEDPGQSRYLFETQRHADLCTALGLGEYAVGTGYEYILDGELPDGLELDQCVVVEG